jgi:hypothetical protein
VIVDEPPLCFTDRLLDGVQLLRKLETAAAFIEHRDDAAHVPLRTPETFDDVCMGLMSVRLCHAQFNILSGRI